MATTILGPVNPLADPRPPEARERDEVWSGVLHKAPLATGTQEDLASDLREFVKRNWARPTGGRVHRRVNVTTPADEEDWLNNYRIPHVVLLDHVRHTFNKDTYIVGPPLVVVEIRSPGDESYEKLPFYAALGVPEVWIIDRDTKVPEVRLRNAAGEYDLQLADADGWHVSPNTGLQMRDTPAKKLRIRVGSDDGTSMELPDS